MMVLMASAVLRRPGTLEGGGTVLHDGLGVVGGETAHGGGLRVGADEEAGEVR